MKKILMAGAVVAVLATTAQAQTVHETCAEVSEIAEQMALARYAGVPMRDIAARVAGSEMFTGMMQEAYSLPDFVMPPSQERAARQFGNKLYALCVERSE